MKGHVKNILDSQASLFTQMHTERGKERKKKKKERKHENT